MLDLDASGLGPHLLVTAERKAARYWLAAKST